MHFKSLKAYLYILIDVEELSIKLLLQEINRKMLDLRMYTRTHMKEDEAKITGN